MELTLERITSGSRLIPFTEHELRAAMENVKLRRSKGTDLSIGHPRFCPDAQSTVDAANEGIIFLHSPVLLETCFAFTKADAGRGFFGGQKAVFPTYVSDDLYLDSRVDIQVMGDSTDFDRKRLSRQWFCLIGFWQAHSQRKNLRP